MKRKALKLTVGSLLGILILSGCSDSKNAVTMNGGEITKEEFYTELKKAPETSQVVLGMIVKDVVDNAYGKEVKQEDVDKEYKKVEEENGGQKPFEALLKENKLEPKVYKEAIKSSLAMNKMLESNVKITDKELKETWETYHPVVEAQIIVCESKEEAEKALTEVNNGGKFEDTVRKYSKEETTKVDGGNISFDSTYITNPENILVPEQVKQEAYKLEDGNVSGVITEQNMQSGLENFYLVKMIKNQKKGNDYKKFEKELQEITKQTIMQDPGFQQKIISEELTKANVKIKDKQFEEVLDPYLPEKEETKESKTEATN